MQVWELFRIWGIKSGVMDDDFFFLGLKVERLTLAGAGGDEGPTWDERRSLGFEISNFESGAR